MRDAIVGYPASVRSNRSPGRTAGGDTSVAKVDMRLEVDIIPVSDVDRAKRFYQRLGFRLDADDSPLPGLRIVQFTPPGSGTSVTFGLGLTTAAPGSAEAGLIVSDIEAAHHQLAGHGIEVSDIWHGPPFPVEARQPGPDPERTSYGSYFYFTDPDGNTWLAGKREPHLQRSHRALHRRDTVHKCQTRPFADRSGHDVCVTLTGVE
jgi:catechol 2,3-dioxygenase-like lactoylglutathione lyase family enzyme